MVFVYKLIYLIFSDVNSQLRIRDRLNHDASLRLTLDSTHRHIQRAFTSNISVHATTPFNSTPVASPLVSSFVVTILLTDSSA